MCSNEVEYYCQSCGQYSEEISNITALQICTRCAEGDNPEQEETILFV